MKQSFMRALALAIVLVSVLSAEPATAKKKKDATPEVKNVILMIGDGMGLAQVAGTIINQGYEPLNIERAQFIGLSKTYSANNRVTDSAAGGTALSTGVKTYNGAIGVDAEGQPVETILEKAEAAGLATGLVATYSVTNATPAAFVAHVTSRKMEERIAEFYLTAGVDVFLGGGKQFFTQREDGRDLTAELRARGYTMVDNLADILAFEGEQLGALLSDNAMPKMVDGRGDYLPQATAKALEILKNNSPKGFFVMVEGSQIDRGGHSNDASVVFTETVDFDRAVGVAMDFADRNPGTLVVVTADHETGGLSIPSGKPDFSLPDQGVKYEFGTGGHTAIFVPIYAYGTGASHFSRIMENTAIPRTLEQLLLKN
ncbi:MAG: alkaline phosphatase [Rikenellaceae bacterium]|jgi:alkaline phosphatase|nr:alkaline phosphatase [Rikenellaceae bacterium]